MEEVHAPVCDSQFLVCPTKRLNDIGVFSPFLRRAFASQAECIYDTAIEQRGSRGVSNSEAIDAYEDILLHPQQDRLDSPAQPMVFQDLWPRHVEAEISVGSALSTRNNAGAIDGWLEGCGVANSSVAGFWKADPLPNCNSSVTGFSRRIGRDPIDTSEPLF